MKLRKVAIGDRAGRIAITDAATNDKHWSDDPDEIKTRITRTMRIDSKWIVTTTTFDVERSILASRLGPDPHQLGGFVFWEFRCLRENLQFDSGGTVLDDDLSKRFVHNTYAKWKALYELGGGVHPGSHWLVSHK